MVDDNQSLSPQKNIVFLFGAGASVPAKCKTTPDLTEWLIQAIQKDSFISAQFSWIIPLWEILQLSSRDFNDQDTTTLPNGHIIEHKRFTPNFENLVYLIELIEDFIDSMPTRPTNQKFFDLLKSLKFHSDQDAYNAVLYSLARLSSDIRSVQPIWQLMSIKGLSAGYMWAHKALLKLIFDQFLTNYDLSYLKGYTRVLRDKELRVVLATTNYDLVFDQFLYENSICYQDGFSNGTELSIWNGFDYTKEDITYLKLHGSLNWFKIEDDWFEEKPEYISPNRIYKVNSLDIMPMLKQELRDKSLKDHKYSFEFNVPHLIMGGLKDKKILTTPFVEIHREWQNALSTAHTILIIGMSASDLHLLYQMKGLLLTNRNLSKIIIINPNNSTHQAFNTFLRDVSIGAKEPVIFNINSYWDLNLFGNGIKLPFEKVLKMTGRELNEHFTLLNKTGSQE